MERSLRPPAWAPPGPTSGNPGWTARQPQANNIHASAGWPLTETRRSADCSQSLFWRKKQSERHTLGESPRRRPGPAPSDHGCVPCPFGPWAPVWRSCVPSRLEGPRRGQALTKKQAHCGTPIVGWPCAVPPTSPAQPRSSRPRLLGSAGDKEAAQAPSAGASSSVPPTGKPAARGY